MFERVFRLKEKGTTIPREIMAGLTTFAAMAYILAVDYGYPPPVDQKKFVAALRGDSRDGFNWRGKVYFDFDANKKLLSASNEYLDGWSRPFVWETGPGGRLAIWSRGSKEHLSRDEAMEKGLYQVLIE